MALGLVGVMRPHVEILPPKAHVDTRPGEPQADGSRRLAGGTVTQSTILNEGGWVFALGLLVLGAGFVTYGFWPRRGSPRGS